MYKYVILILALIEILYGIARKSRRHAFSGVCIFMIFGIVFIVSMASKSKTDLSKEEIIKQTVEEIKTKLPQHGNPISFTGIEGTEDSIIYTYTLNKTESERLENNKKERIFLRNNMREQILNSPSPRPLLKKGIKLVFNYINPENQTIFFFKLEEGDTYKQKKAVSKLDKNNNNNTKILNIEDELKRFAYEYNKGLPRMAGGDIRLDSVIAGPGKECTFMATFINNTYEEVDSDAYVKTVKPILVNNFKTAKEMEVLRAHNVVCIYKYFDKNGKEVLTFSIKKSDF